MSATKFEEQHNGATHQGVEARPDIIEPAHEPQASENDIVDNNVVYKGNNHDGAALRQPVPDENLHIQRPAISVPPIERLPVKTSTELRHTMASQE